MKVKVVFDLPEGMSEQDLMILLKDSLDDFRTVRCNGDAQAYAAKAQAVVHDSLQPHLERKIHEVQTRFDWTRHFAADSRNMEVQRGESDHYIGCGCLRCMSEEHSQDS